MISKLNSTLVKPYFFEAANELLYGRYSSAIHIMRKIRLLFPYYPFNDDEYIGLQSAYGREIAFLWENELTDTGISIVEEALQFFPRHAGFLTLKAQFLMKQNKISEAELYAQKALALEPYSLRAVQLLRRILFHQGKYHEGYNIWCRLVPQEIFTNSNNLLQDRYYELQIALANFAPEKNTSALALARALARFGWEQEAKIVLATF